MALQRACERYTYMVEAGRPGRELGAGSFHDFHQQSGFSVYFANYAPPVLFFKQIHHLQDGEA